MVRVNSNGALTIVRKTRRDGKARGVMTRNNLSEALARSKNTVVMSKPSK